MCKLVLLKFASDKVGEGCSLILKQKSGECARRAQGKEAHKTPPGNHPKAAEAPPRPVKKTETPFGRVREGKEAHPHKNTRKQTVLSARADPALLATLSCAVKKKIGFFWGNHNITPTELW